MLPVTFNELWVKHLLGLKTVYSTVVIKNTNFRVHVINVRHILDTVRAAGFTLLNALKCSFFQYKIAYLGHIIQKGAVTIDPNRVAAINTFPVPHDVHSLHRFIGMAQFCRKFIPKLNVILTPLFKLLNTNAPFEWTPDCEQSFHSVKSLMTNAPVLCSPTRQDHIILETDACDYGSGACLKGLRTDNTEYIITYASHKFTDAESKWNIVEKEGFGLINAVRHFRHFLIGKKFTIRVDSRIVVYVQYKHQPINRKLLYWALELSEFDYDICHIPATDNLISDCLRRLKPSHKDSSLVVLESLPNVSDIQWLRLQLEDREISECIKYLQQGRK